MAQPDDTFTPISSVGEFGLIDRMREILPPYAETIEVGIGDDAAAYRVAGDVLQLVTTDTLIEHVHFDRTYTPLRHLGYKALSVNVSDIAAMNGLARLATVAIGLPNSVSIEMVDALYEGLRDAALDYGVSVVGGDTTAATKLVLSVTVVGDCKPSDLVRRSGAAPGNLICVSGTLGASYAGLRILQHHKQQLLQEGDEYQANLAGYETVIQRHLRPFARVDIVSSLGGLNLKPTAMIDISDGLASDLRQLCKKSECGAEIEWEALPVASETKAAADLLDEPLDRYCLRGGEDYELLFCVDSSQEEVVRAIDDVTIIGVCIPTDDGIRLTRSGTSKELVGSGFSHF